MSHEAFMQLTGAGFTEEQTRALFEVYGNERTSVTQADLERFATKEDLQEELQRFATQEDLQRELQRFATKEDLQALELRLTLRFGGLVVGAVAVLAVLDRF